MQRCISKNLFHAVNARNAVPGVEKYEPNQTFYHQQPIYHLTPPPPPPPPRAAALRHHKLNETKLTINCDTKLNKTLYFCITHVYCIFL